MKIRKFKTGRTGAKLIRERFTNVSRYDIYKSSDNRTYVILTEDTEIIDFMRSYKTSKVYYHE